MIRPQDIPRPFYLDLPGKYYHRHTWGAQFRPAGRPSVKGGRWQIRKMRDGRWRAWTSGQAKTFSMYFYDFEEAIAWAQLIAAAYADKLNVRDRYYLLLCAKRVMQDYNKAQRRLRKEPNRLDKARRTR